jgi:hypothetical protein
MFRTVRRTLGQPVQTRAESGEGELGLPEPERGEPPPIDSCRFPLSDQFFISLIRSAAQNLCRSP